VVPLYIYIHTYIQSFVIVFVKCTFTYSVLRISRMIFAKKFHRKTPKTKEANNVSGFCKLTRSCKLLQFEMLFIFTCSCLVNL